MTEIDDNGDNKNIGVCENSNSNSNDANSNFCTNCKNYSWIKLFLDGFKVPFSGFVFILNNTSLKRYVFIILGLYCVIFFGGIFVGFYYIPILFQKLTNFNLDFGIDFIKEFIKNFVAGGFFHSLFFYIFYIIYAVLLFGLMSILTYFVGALIGSPFYFLLSEQTLKLLNGLSQPSQSWIEISFRMLLVSLVKLGFFSFISFVLFFISYIPLIGLISPGAIFLMFAFDSMDYAFESVLFSFTQRLMFFFKNFIAFVGLATVIGLCLLIPGVNLLLFPSMIVGSTKLFHELRQRVSSNP